MSLASPASESQLEKRMSKRFRTLQIVSLLAAAIGLICFFLPWVRVWFSHGGEIRIGSILWSINSLTGYQLATGNGPTGIKIPIPSWTSLFLTPVSMLAVLALVLPCLLSKKFTTSFGRRASIVSVAAGGVSIAAISYLYFSGSTYLDGQEMTLIRYQFGMIVSLLGSLIVAIAGVINLRTSNKAKHDGTPEEVA